MAYYRIYLTQQNRVAIVEMGESDEIDYNQARFLSDERFDSESEAQQYLQGNEFKLPAGIENPYSKKFKGVLD